MATRTESEQQRGNPDLLAGAFKVMGIVQERSQSAVDAAISEQQRVMNLEGNHSLDDAAASLIADNPRGMVLNAMTAAEEYDKVHGSSITPLVRQRLIAKNPTISL